MKAKIFMRDFEIHSTPLEEIIINACEIKIFLDDVNEERYKITICPYQAFRVTTADCFLITTYYNEFCFRDGIYHTHILEIEDSEWIKNLKETLTDEHATFLNDVKHYVLPLQENVIEFVTNKFNIIKSI